MSDQAIIAVFALGFSVIAAIVGVAWLIAYKLGSLATLISERTADLERMPTREEMTDSTKHLATGEQVARLEARMEATSTREQVGRLETTLESLKEEMKHLRSAIEIKLTRAAGEDE